MSRRCCCNEGCLIYFDDFNRADNTDLGSGWDEISGDWSILDNELVVPGTANAKVLCTTPNPLAGNGVVMVDIEPTNGAKYRIILNSNAAGTSYKYVEAECLTGSLILTAGSETRTYTTADGWDITARPMGMTACVAEGLLSVSVGTMGFAAVVWDNTVTVDQSDRYAGLMNGGTVSLTWDNFCYYHHVDDGIVIPDSGGAPDCDFCVCYCVKENGKKSFPPWRMKVDGFADCCPTCCCCEWDGFCAVFEYDALNGYWMCVDSGTVCGRPYPATDTLDPETPYPSPTIRCEDLIGSYAGETARCGWILDMFACCLHTPATPGCTPENYGCHDIPAHVLVCEPFSLRFDITVQGGGSRCGTCCQDLYDVCGFYLIASAGVCP